MKKKFLQFLKKYRRPIRYTVRTVIKSRWLITILILLFLFITSLGVANNVYVFYMKKKYVNVFEMKMLIVSYIKEKMKKAVEMGVVDFNMFEGVTFEDIKVSAEEDFSNNRIFFQAGRVDIRFSSLFSKQVSIEKVIFHNTKFEVESNVSFSDLTKELYASGLPSLEFRNLTVVGKENGKISWRTNRPIQLRLEKRKEEFAVIINDSLFYFDPFTQVKGNGVLNIKKNSLEVLMEMKDFPVTHFPGVLENLTYLSVESGDMTGFFRINDSEFETNVDGNFNLYSITGKVHGMDKIRVSKVPFNCKFSYFKEIENDKTQVYFQRKLNNPDFYYNESYHKSKEDLSKWIITGFFQNLEKLSSSIEMEDGTGVSGSLRMDFSIEDQLKGPEKFKIDGVMTGNNFQIKRKNPNIDLSIKNGGIRINPDGRIEANMDMEVFKKKGSLGGQGIVQFLRSTEADYQVSANTNMNINIDKIIFSDFQEIYDSVKKGIEDDIKERQEKMLPESYLVKNPLYKKFFERMNFQGKLASESFSNEENGKELGPLALDIKYLNRNLDLELLSKSENPFFQVNLKGIIDRSVPYFDFRFKLNDYPWNKPVIEYCGYDFVPKNLNLNLAVQSSGNNFSDLTGRKSYALLFELLGTDFVFKKEKTEDVSELFQNKDVNIKGSRAGYALEGFFRELEINSDSLSFKGNGNISKTGNHVFNFWGTLGGKYTSWNLIAMDGKKCQYIRK